MLQLLVSVLITKGEESVKVVSRNSAPANDK